MLLPCDFVTKNGYGSKYLTGLVTPDGITFFASENNLLDFDNSFLEFLGIIIRSIRNVGGKRLIIRFSTTNNARLN